MKKIALVSSSIFPLFVIGFVLVQSLFVWINYNDKNSGLLAVICIIALIFYYLGVFLGGGILPRFKVKASKDNLGKSRLMIHIFIIINIILFIYYGQIPFFEYLINGKSPLLARRDFAGAFSSGYIEAFYYAKSILLRGVLPFVIVFIAMHDSTKRYYVYLITLSFLLMSTFEKANVFWVYFPLFLLFLLTSDFKRLFHSFLLFCFSFFIIATIQVSVFVTSIDDNKGDLIFSPQSDIIKNDQKLSSTKSTDISKNFLKAGFFPETPNYRFYLQYSSSQLAYLVNRMFWIPYITAYDTILYWKYRYDYKHIGASVNRHLAYVFGLNFADLEREVFRFQYGSGADSTGNANAFYGAEAFVAFGIVGVVVFSLIIGLVFSVFIFSYSYEGGLLLFSASFGLVNASLISMLFSGGLAFSLLVIFIYSKKVRWIK